MYPINNHTAIGLVGDYRGHLAAYNSAITQTRDGMTLEEIKNIFVASLSSVCNDYNGVLVQCNGFGNTYCLISNNIHLDSEIKMAETGFVKVLIPPDATGENCAGFFNQNTTDLKQTIIDCVKGVSTISSSVNDKVFGLEFSNTSLQSFTDGIEYEEIDNRIHITR